MPNGTARKDVVPEFPEIDDASELVANPPPLSDEVICGVLRRGWKMVLGGSSKSFKTWSLADCAISIATGMQWWGFETKPGKVLYLQFENQRAGFARRLRAISDAKQSSIEQGKLRVWNLRGHTSNVATLIAKVADHARGEGYSALVVDPLYKLTAGRDENAAGEMAKALEPLDHLAEQTGAAIIYGHHFSKGNQSAKESIDRMSGSRVFSRDADSILTLTRHEEDDAFTVEPILRECPPVEPFVVRWAFPLMSRDECLDPSKLKKPKTGREPLYTEDDVLTILREAKQLTSSEWLTIAIEATGMSRRTFFTFRKKLEAGKKIIKSRLEADTWMPR